MASPRQPQVVDEIWDDHRIRGFLKPQPFDNQSDKQSDQQSDQRSADFHVLLKAYQGMRVADFQRFIRFFIEAGGDVNARDDKGRTILDIISKHRQAGEFVKVLEASTVERNTAG